MNGKTSLVAAGAAIVRRNKRYIVWFYLLNLAFAHFGATAFSDAAAVQQRTCIRHKRRTAADPFDRSVIISP